MYCEDYGMSNGEEERRQFSSFINSENHLSPSTWYVEGQQEPEAGWWHQTRAYPRSCPVSPLLSSSVHHPPAHASPTYRHRSKDRLVTAAASLVQDIRRPRSTTGYIRLEDRARFLQGASGSSSDSSAGAYCKHSTNEMTQVCTPAPMHSPAHGAADQPIVTSHRTQLPALPHDRALVTCHINKHTPLTQRRSADVFFRPSLRTCVSQTPTPVQSPLLHPKMVRQASERRTRLTIEGSPKLPQRSRSLRAPKRVTANRKPATQPLDLLGVHDAQVQSRDRTRSFDTLKYGRGSLKQLKARDEWPQPVKPSYLEKRFLQLPHDEYQRLRTFVIDPKGHVINRGDSFRLRSGTGDTDTSSSPAGSSRGGSPRTVSRELPHAPAPVDNQGNKAPRYSILVMGMQGVGKTSVIQQFKTADHCNPFNVEFDEESTTVQQVVPVILHGQESELVFVEADSENRMDWLSENYSAYLIIYSVDTKATFRHALSLLAELRTVMTGHKSCPPIIIAGNKVDLARRRTVLLEEAKTACKQHKVQHQEVSVALNHGIDELLVGVVSHVTDDVQEEPEEGQSLMKRFSSRKRQKKVRAGGSLSAPLAHDQNSTTLTAVGNSAVRMLNRILKGKNSSKSCEKL